MELIVKRGARATTKLICVALGLSQAWCSATVFSQDTFTAASGVLLERCVACHHPDQKSGGLDLTSAAAFRAGGDSGEVVDPAAAIESYLLQRVRDGEMPPEEKGISQALDPAEAETLQAWVIDGAPWPEDRHLDPFEKTTSSRAGRDWWAFQPIHRAAPPASQLASDWALNPIDSFIGKQLELQELQPAPPADKATLVRRLYIDLIGIPPTQSQIQAFVSDPAPNAYEKVVDELLASPHFGERWARYWLDLVRFAETSGYERDQVKPFAWRYRDWVVQAFNDDMPYDQFVTWQLAGDEIEGANESSVIATGLLRLGTWNDEPNDPQEYKYERLEDLVHVTSSAFLGLTVKCARCHDHKFDPIPQLDYYRMAAAFWPGPIEPRSSELLGGPTTDELGYSNVLGWTDLGPRPSDLHLLKNGDPKRPLDPVAPGFLSLLPELDRPLEMPSPESTTSQRRRQWTQWLVEPANPLTPRVIVNRLWQHHFGNALVRSPNNFGFTGELPTHPELLDWLATELTEPTVELASSDSSNPMDMTPWSLKRIHKLMVMSSTYRQSSNHPDYPENETIDPANRLWWHAQRRRIDAEVLRDSMLLAAGQLDLTLGGESFRGSIDAEALEGLSRKGGAWQASPLAEQSRRTLYMFTQRSLLDPFLTTFDFADTTLPCAQRDSSTVAPQALALFNGSLTHRQSAAIARRIEQRSDKPTEQARWAWRLILAREPTQVELAMSVQHLQEQRKLDISRRQLAILDTTGDDWPSDLRLALFGDSGVEADAAGRVVQWKDQSGSGHHASQIDSESRPLSPANSDGRGLRFDGQGRFLRIAGQLLEDSSCTIIAVVTDTGESGHREILSNWNGAQGNSVNSVFLGLTSNQTLRFSDALVGGLWQGDRLEPTVITAINNSSNARVWVNDQLAIELGSPLPNRRLDTEWIIGQQGNIDGEYWNGSLLALLVWDRDLSEPEQQRALEQLSRRFDLELVTPRPLPDFVALQSLCHVLLNSNEFLYVD